MSFMDELKRFARPYEDEDEELDEEYEEEEAEDEAEDEEPEEEAPARPARTERPARTPRTPRAARAAAPAAESNAAGGSYYGTQEENKGVAVHATPQAQVVLVKTDKFDNVGAIADHLIARRTVVLNLESCERAISRRLLDFLSGVAYANKGKITRVATSTYIITPFNVDMQGELMDELEANGLHF